MNVTSHRERLETAVRLHVAGQLREAIAVYGEVLAAAPNDPDALQRFGAALAQLGNFEDGAHLMTLSLEAKPDQPAVLLNLARALLSLGRPEDALQCADRVVSLDSSSSDAFRLRGTALTAQGKNDQALASFGQAVRLAPADPNALLDLGAALDSSGRLHDALTCFQRAIELDPRHAPSHHNMGLIAARSGDFTRALASFERALAQQPRNSALLTNRGTSLKELGRLPEALESFSQALSIEPSYEALHNHAVVSRLLDRPVEALRDYDELSARYGLKDRDLLGRGMVLIAVGWYAEAEALLRRAAAALPDDPEAHIQLGVALQRLERHQEAIEAFTRALSIKGNVPEVLNNRGVALEAVGRSDEALEDFIAAAAVAGDTVDAHTNMGVLFKSLGRYRQAAASFDRALTLDRNDPAARFELGFLQLTLGELRKGWPLYEARFRVPALAIPPREFAVPRWTGAESLASKSILVHAEQGLGDTIQFARYLPLLAARGAKVVFELMPQLQALLQSLPGAADIVMVPRGQPAAGPGPGPGFGAGAAVQPPLRSSPVAVDTVPRGQTSLRSAPVAGDIVTPAQTLPPVDYHIPLLSLPLAFDTQLSTIPNKVPYLAAAPERVAKWASALEQLCPASSNPPSEKQGVRGLRVGIAWQGNPQVERLIWARGRSMPLAALAPLAQLPNVSLISLQKGFGTEQLATAPFKVETPDLDTGPDAFLDTAALMANLDLIITTDTSIAHLAGALGRPVWVALNPAPDWRWLLEREDSPWYPTMRLFRQTDRNKGWAPVVAAMAADLTKLATRQ